MKYQIIASNLCLLLLLCLLTQWW